ncbi:MAG: Addiction module toxin, RelE/StbE family [Candidatus Woesebacteria bacterium GW2011_GWA1_33_30]|uniref:Addiction module toxin, RelE/StbE family n=1 Tax=Candidatus Woesebacteria bacterium GW2011_GWA2_33_28 TaxID=1618561 RepID=A0A0F9ZV07_9BACT|nr:MAG: Addiction module toxin, RelE/StbE family [Candidatus Woesebacteria bacterium GW2011_GWA2_33_28]KKP48995.1 MAG: Addiction module toxin, RelE/StbE family [Candidatus Woesebacteria bacterium GW2011_GWA1_33_30]KKP49897.1 MAG: Addiction module toxin, RelE/StbE family [Microgenomates group bacterium GW2011_GWC1_33_32]KKP52587.1 MAG: Addiction module toxin, RelE/StbE family [Candidatus Woesebacteria bacterium GW2011_GWB1_33_38]KKP55771.1 MAG: Addiction module toxin, RelE/StbE family [Microgeno
MIKIVRSGKYTKMLQEIDNNELLDKIQYLINLFIINPDDSRLYNHALRKRMKGKYAFSITGDIRIVYEWLGKQKVRFLAIGGHNKVYTR